MFMVSYKVCWHLCGNQTFGTKGEALQFMADNKFESTTLFSIQPGGILKEEKI